MQKCAIYKDGDGVAIVYPSPALFDKDSLDRHLLREQDIDFENDEQVYDWIFKKDVPAGVEYKVINVSEIPVDRTFRKAWEYQE